MKYQPTHPSQRGYIPNTFSYMIKLAKLNLAIQMLSFGRSPQLNLHSTLQKWPVHHLIPSLNRPQVLVVLSSRLTPMDTFFSSNSTLMVLDPLLASMLQFCSPSSQQTTAMFSNGPPQSSYTLVLEINWTH